jgi:hypothetical protein
MVHSVLLVKYSPIYGLKPCYNRTGSNSRSRTGKTIVNRRFNRKRKVHSGGSRAAITCLFMDIGGSKCHVFSMYHLSTTLCTIHTVDLGLMESVVKCTWRCNVEIAHECLNGRGHLYALEGALGES